MNITEEQKSILQVYLPNLDEFTKVSDLLISLDDVINEIGFTKDYKLNTIGHKLQRIYDELYMSI